MLFHDVPVKKTMFIYSITDRNFSRIGMEPHTPSPKAPTTGMNSHWVPLYNVLPLPN